MGYKYITTRGNSMEPTLSSGSLLVAKSTSPQEIQAGDIIAFPGTWEGAPNIVHRVVVLQDDGNNILAVTKGDNNQVIDPGILTLDGAMPRVVLEVPHLGWWLTPTLGWYAMAAGGLLALRSILRLISRRNVNSYAESMATA